MPQLSVPANGWLSEGYGPRPNPQYPYHYGVDFGWLTAQSDFRIFAAAPGVVTRVSYTALLGYTISILHDDGTSTDYWHLADKGLVSIGQRVARRQHIATMGATGTSASGQRHLHFNYWVNGVRIDPMPYMTGFAADDLTLIIEPEQELEMAQYAFTPEGGGYIVTEDGAMAMTAFEWAVEQKLMGMQANPAGEARMPANELATLSNLRRRVSQSATPIVSAQVDEIVAGVVAALPSLDPEGLARVVRDSIAASIPTVESIAAGVNDEAASRLKS